ncbi:MAG: hypothetical protein ACRQFF_06230 [Sphaerochaeta sp.]
MRKIQTRQIKVNKLPVSNELIMYSHFKTPRELANVAEVWDEEVADFYMDLFPESLDLGANISDLQQRAELEAYTGMHNVTAFLHFLDGMMRDGETLEDDEED